MRPRHFDPVVFQPQARQGMQRGINQFVDAVRPTLGPRPRIVAIAPIHPPNDPPELLDTGGLIARRLHELPDRDADVGAMFVRHVLWRVHKRVADGTATAAVMLQSVFNEGARYLAAGGDPVALRHHLGVGMELTYRRLAEMARPVQGEEELAQLAESICQDVALGAMLGEIFDIIGEYGQLDVRAGRGRRLEREYVEGMYWKRGVVSREMITDHSKLRVEIHNPAIVISDVSVDDPHELVPVLVQARKEGYQGLLLVAQDISRQATSLLLSASQNPDAFRAIAVRTPGDTSSQRAETMADLAALTGGRPVIEGAGDRLKRIGPGHLGRARRVWADYNYFGVVGGGGDARGLRSHIRRMRAAFENATDEEVRDRLQERIGKLMGGSATLWVGGATESEIETQRQKAERTADVLRAALREGVVPGGGVALLDCRSEMRERLGKSSSVDERAAYRILSKALEEPTRTLLANAGYEAAEVMAQINLAGPGVGFDVRSERVVDMREAGVWDAAAVLRTAVRSAIGGAALALTTDVMIHRQDREQVMDP